MNKNIKKILIISMIFLLWWNSFANNNNLNELELIWKKIISSKQENLQKLHSKIINLEEKIDLGWIKVDEKTKAKFKKMAKIIVLDILEKKKQENLVIKVLEDIFEEDKKSQEIDEVNFVLKKVFEQKKKINEVDVVLKNVFNKDKELIKKDITTIVLDKVFNEKQKINEVDVVLKNIFTEKKVNNENIINKLLAKIFNTNELKFLEKNDENEKNEIAKMTNNLIQKAIELQNKEEKKKEKNALKMISNIFNKSLQNIKKNKTNNLVTILLENITSK